MALRTIEWLRRLDVSLWTAETGSGIWVDALGRIIIRDDGGSALHVLGREGEHLQLVADDMLEIMAPCSFGGRQDPDLRRPRPHLRFIPGKLAGAPHGRAQPASQGACVRCDCPPPIVAALSRYIPETELVPIGNIDSRMLDLDDWQILVALKKHDRPWARLVTNDADFFSQPRELAALMQTKLAVIVAEAAGHDAIKATGLLLAHLPAICKRISPGHAQLGRPKAVDRNHDEP